MQSVKILVIGDIIVDEFLFGEVKRISPEAPVPIMNFTHGEMTLGGAANVFRNLITLGADANILGVVGDDSHGHMVHKELVSIIIDEKRKTSLKRRYIAEHATHTTHLLRVDDEYTFFLSTETERKLIGGAIALIPKMDVVILSDYGKGTLTNAVIHHTMEQCKKFNIPLFIDPKRKDWSAYRGATVITPNNQEFIDSADWGIEDFETVAITKGEKGITLFQNGKHLTEIPAYPVSVYDVSGAGDTFVATLAYLWMMPGASLIEKVRLAGVAASLVVSKPGVATNRWEEVISTQWHWTNFKVGFTSGCFDTFHEGHRHILNEAKKHCDKLIVGLNSDDSVKRLKGEDRPKNSVLKRAEVLMNEVNPDLITVFDEDTPIEVIKRVKPNIIFKGGDYEAASVVGNQYADVMIIPLVDKKTGSEEPVFEGVQ